MRLSYGLTASPPGVQLEVEVGAVPSALPLSPMKAMCWPCTTRLPTAMPGANAHPRAFRPSSVPGVSLLMCMYQYSHPSASRSTSMFPLFVDVSCGRR